MAEAGEAAICEAVRRSFSIHNALVAPPGGPVIITWFARRGYIPQRIIVYDSLGNIIARVSCTTHQRGSVSLGYCVYNAPEAEGVYYIYFREYNPESGEARISDGVVLFVCRGSVLEKLYQAALTPL